jgi:uncharacterized membrane protein
MYRTMIGCLTAGLIAVIGCESKSPPGGPGVNDDNQNSHVSTPDNTFRVSVPSATLKQGETKAVTVSIKRGTSFDQDVMLEVENAPQGVTFKFDDPAIKASAAETHLTIEASKDAALGEHKIMISAKPARSGAATETELKVEIKKP